MCNSSETTINNNSNDIVSTIVNETLKINKTNGVNIISNITNSPTTTQTNNISLNSINCQKIIQAANVNITNNQNTDIFLPKINLLLQTMYASVLVNSNISFANYSWAIANNSMISNINYTIIYQNIKSMTFAFNVGISNN